MKHNNSQAAIYEDQALNQGGDYSSQSAMQHHLSSVPLRRRKEYQPQLLQQSQSLTLVEPDGKGHRKSGGRSSQIGTKENSASFSNMQYDFVGNQSQMLPPASSSHMHSQSRKSARNKKKKKALEREKDLQMQALQLQFMQETLSKLQKEKQSRAEQLRSTLSRRNSSKGGQVQSITVVKTARTSQKNSVQLSKNGSQNELKKTGRTSKNVEKASRSNSRRGTNAAKAGALRKTARSDSRLSSNSQSRVRTHPRLCEMSQSELDASATNMPRQMATRKVGQEGASANQQAQRSQSPLVTSDNSKKQIKAQKILKQYQKHAQSIRKADLNQTGLTAQLEQSSARPIQRRDNVNDSQVAVRSFFKSQQASMQHSMVMPTSKLKSRGSNQLQMSQDQGGRIHTASQELLREDSETSELTQEYEEAAVCQAPLQIECLDNAIERSSIQEHRYGEQALPTAVEEGTGVLDCRVGASPVKVAKKCNQKDGKDSIDAFRSISREPSNDQLDMHSQANDHTNTNKEEKHSKDMPEAIEQHRRPQSQAQIHPELQIISERQLSSGGTQNQSSRQQDIADFFEKEYKNSQRDLLATKAQLYEQQFKTEILKKKIVEYEQAQSQMNEEINDLRHQLSQQNANNCLCNETATDSQVVYQKDLEAVKSELLKIQDQSAMELGKYEQTVKQMTMDQATDLKRHRQFVKNLVSEISVVETVIAQSQLSDPANQQVRHDGFEEVQRGKLACRFNQIYKTLKNLNDEIINRKKQLGRTTDMQKLLFTMRTSQGAADTVEQSFNQGEFDESTTRAQNTHDYLAQDPFRNQNYIDNSSQQRSQTTLVQSREEPSSLKIKQQCSQNSVGSKAFAAQTQNHLQLMTSMNQNLVTEARTITNDCVSVSSTSKAGMEAPTPSMGHQPSSKLLDSVPQTSQDQQHLQQQQQLADMVQKLQSDLNEVKSQSGQLLDLNHKLEEENKELKQKSILATERSNETRQRQNTMRSGLDSDRRISQDVVEDEAKSLQQEKKQLVQLVESLKTQQQSQDVMIQYLQGTQNSILQKMQHQVIKNQFSQSLVESAALANSFLQKDSLPMISHTTSSGEKYDSTISHKQTQDGGADGSSSLDMRYFMAQKQQDISQSIRAYDQERGNSESSNLMGEQKRIGDGSKYTSRDSSPLPPNDQLPESRQRNELNIIDETAEKVYCDRNNSDSESQSEMYFCDKPASCGNGIDARQDYDSKTLSEHNRQYVQQQRGISPVGQIRRVDSRKSLSYQKQASSMKAHDVSVVSLSHLGSNSKQVPEQMRQLLRLQSSQDGTEADRYQETGAFEKRSGEIRLFSLESTAQQDHLMPAEDLSGTNLGDAERGEMSPVKNFEANDFQSNQLLNLVQCMQDASAQSRDQKFAGKPQKPVQQLQSPQGSPSPDEMRQRIMFSAELGKSEDRLSQLSSPEMDLCITRSESGFTTQNQTLKTKEQREIEQIIAQTKISQEKAHTSMHANEYASQPQDNLALRARQNSSLVRAVQNAECHSQIQFQVKSPSFHQPDASLTLPFLSKEETNSDEVMQDYANHPTKSSQEHGHYREQDPEQEVEHLMPRTSVKASLELPNGNSTRIVEHLRPRQQQPSMTRQKINMSDITNYDERSCTTISVSNGHNIRRSSHTPVPRALHHSALTSHETTFIDNLLPRENTQGCAPGDRLVTASLQHMPTQQYMPTQKMTTNPLGANQSVMYSPFKTHQCHFTQQGSFPFSRSRSTSPNQNEVGGGGLAASSERIQKRTKAMQQEIDCIDQEIAKLQNDISR